MAVAKLLLETSYIPLSVLERIFFIGVVVLQLFASLFHFCFGHQAIVLFDLAFPRRVVWNIESFGA